MDGLGSWFNLASQDGKMEHGGKMEIETREYGEAWQNLGNGKNRKLKMGNLQKVGAWKIERLENLKNGPWLSMANHS